VLVPLFQGRLSCLKKATASRCRDTQTIFSSFRKLSNQANYTEHLTQLGRKVPLPKSPAEATLERVPNMHRGQLYVARFTCPEFTSLCPLTGQPDFCHMVIDYIPDEWLVESKSLKLYLHSFRNHGDFHEACTIGIARKLTGELKPKWLRIAGYWYPRGGIPIDVFYQTGEPPAGVWIPENGVQPYRGRG
jgi:7-cyano-7-deazaguanine reductase